MCGRNVLTKEGHCEDGSGEGITKPIGEESKRS